MALNAIYAPPITATAAPHNNHRRWQVIATGLFSGITGGLTGVCGRAMGADCVPFDPKTKRPRAPARDFMGGPERNRHTLPPPPGCLLPLWRRCSCQRAQRTSALQPLIACCLLDTVLRFWSHDLWLAIEMVIAALFAALWRRLWRQ